MKLLAIIVFGISIYIIIRRYILARFLKNFNKFLYFNRLNIPFSKFNASFDEKNNHRKLSDCKSVSKISSTKNTSTVFPTNRFANSTFQLPLGGNYALLVHQYHRIINNRGFRVCNELKKFEKIFDAHTILKLRLRSRIDYEKGLKVTSIKNGGKISTFQDMDDFCEATSRDGNHAVEDIDRLDALEAVECHAVSPETKANAEFDKEDNGFDTIIRRLVAAELMKCCEKEHALVNRAKSDTNVKINWKKNNCSSPFFDKFHRKQNIKLNEDSNDVESRANFCKIFPKEYVGKTDNDIEPKKPLVQSVTKNVKPRDSYDEIGPMEVVIPDDDASTSCGGRVPQKNKKPGIEDNETSVQEPEAQETMIKTTRADTALPRGLVVEKFEDAATQTEQMYMIRGVRSCPGSRKHLQRLGVQRGMSTKYRNSGKSFSMEISLPLYLLRKSSDNLIYEKEKGSRSPSYIPVPERFRWRYVAPRKIN